MLSLGSKKRKRVEEAPNPKSYEICSQKAIEQNHQFIVQRSPQNVEDYESFPSWKEYFHSFLQEQKDKREGYEVIRIEQRRKFYMELSGQSSQKEDTKYINLIVETLIEVVTKLVDANDDLSVITFYSSKPGKRGLWSFSIHLIFVNLICPEGYSLKRFAKKVQEDYIEESNDVELYFDLGVYKKHQLFAVPLSIETHVGNSQANVDRRLYFHTEYSPASEEDSKRNADKVFRLGCITVIDDEEFENYEIPESYLTLPQRKEKSKKQKVDSDEKVDRNESLEDFVSEYEANQKSRVFSISIFRRGLRIVESNRSRTENTYSSLELMVVIVLMVCTTRVKWEHYISIEKKWFIFVCAEAVVH